MRRGSRGDAGFALLVVIWAIGIISLLIVTVMTTARWGLQTAFNTANAARAALVAEAAISLATLGAANDLAAASPTGAPPVHDGQPLFCRIADAAVVIAVESESGKIDLNAAPPNVLTMLFQGFGVDPRRSAAIASAIFEYRTLSPGPMGKIGEASPDAERPFRPKHALFQSVLELEQVAGVDHELAQLVTPFVTVHSHTPGVSPQSAPPALFAALSGASLADVLALREAPYPNALNRTNPHFPAEIQVSSDTGAVLIHSETLLLNGQVSVREQIVEMRGTAATPLSILELRRGRARYLGPLRAAQQGGENLPPC